MTSLMGRFTYFDEMLQKLLCSVNLQNFVYL